MVPTPAGQSHTLASVLTPSANPYSNLPTFTNAQWYGSADGVSPVSDLRFSGSGLYNVSLMLRETGNALVFGWYTFDDFGVVTNGGVLVDSTVGPLGSATYSNVQFMAPSASFGFFLKYGKPADCTGDDWRAVCHGTVLSSAGGSGIPMDVFYTQIARNSAVLTPSPGAPSAAYYEADYQGARQHFVAIKTDQGLIVGAEDGWSTSQALGTLNTPYLGGVWEKTGDFNDLVVQISDVPEPSSLALLGLGLTGFALFLRRRSA